MSYTAEELIIIATNFEKIASESLNAITIKKDKQSKTSALFKKLMDKYS